MKITPLKDEIRKYLKKHQLERKFRKAKGLFEQDMSHPSLNVELLEPKHLKICSFRLDRKYRAIFIVVNNEAEILTVCVQDKKMIEGKKPGFFWRSGNLPVREKSRVSRPSQTFCPVHRLTVTNHYK